MRHTTQTDDTIPPPLTFLTLYPEPIDIQSCRHCGQTYQYRTHRARRLCLPCYEDEEIRSRYPVSDTRHASNGPATDPWAKRASAKLPQPTRAQPGSEAKVRVLEQRVASGEALFHPDDVQCFDPRPLRRWEI